MGLNTTGLHSIRLETKSMKKYDFRLLEIVNRHLRSLFLEFVPVSYSAVMIELYLSEKQGEKETN